MKKLKKVLLALVAISIVACGFSVFASASAPASAEILEFYESKIYVNENFDKFTDSDDVSVNDIFAGTANEYVVGDFGKSSMHNGVLTVSNLGTVHNGIVFDNNSGIGMNVTFAFNDSAVTNGFAVALHTSESFNSQTNNPLPLFIKSANGVKIASGSGASYTESIVESSFYSEVSGLTDDTFYTVQAFCKYEGSVLCGSVAVVDEDGDVIASSQFDISGYNPVAITTAFSAPATKVNTISIDSIEIYEGSFARSLNDFDLAVGEMLIEIANGNDYEALVDANKVIVDYNFNTGSIEDLDKAVEINDAIDTIIIKLAESYAESFKVKVSEFDATLDYVSRKALVDTAALYASSLYNIQDNYADQWAELDADGSITAALELYEAEYAAIESVENETLAYIGAVDSIANLSTATFSEIEAAYDVLSANEFCITYRSAEYDETLINAIYEKGIAICEAYEVLVEKGDAFVDNVIIAYVNLFGESEDTSFATGYEAYLLAVENYISDSTYVPDSSKYSSYAALIEEYNECVVYVNEVKQIANAFFTAIEDAELSESFTVKVSSINEAGKYYDSLEFEYPGVTEAVEKYRAALKMITDTRNIALEYIKAVLAIDNAVSLVERKDAVKYALELSAGADSSVDVTYQGMTVLQANIKLSAVNSALEYAETIVGNFISAVAAIDSKNTAESRRAAIISALNYKLGLVNVEDADNPNLDGVKSSIKALNDAIESYNADVASSNATYEKSCEVASSTVCASFKVDAPVKKVVAIIKKVYD